jgi:hypothetical protein
MKSHVLNCCRFESKINTYAKGTGCEDGGWIPYAEHETNRYTWVYMYMYTFI